MLLVPGVNLALAQDVNLPELVRRTKPSVVAIVTYDSKGEQLSRGSGFFVTPDRVITNRHVIENAYKAEVHHSNGFVYRVTGVLAVDGEGDIALLQVDVPPNVGRPLQVIKVSPQEGESIVVIGNPLGLEGSVSNGIVSAVRDIAGFGRIIQITAPISSGSSGSPVVNMQGQVIGVATLQLTDGQSLNFAVPSERVVQLQSGPSRTLGEVVVATQKSQRATAERYYIQGLGFLSGDNCEKAIPYFQKATDADANFPEAWSQEGLCQEKLGRHAEALKASKQAVHLRPDSTESYYNIGLASFGLGQFKEAIDAYKQVIRLDPYNPDAQYALGLAYGAAGRTEEEVSAYKKAISIRSEYAFVYERLGLAYVKLSKLNEAVAAFRQLTLLKPDDANAYNNLGETFTKLKKYDEANEALNQAIRLKPDFGKAYFNLGKSYLTQGDRDAAIIQYNLLKNLDSSWAEKLYDLIYP
jgi:tetratricopeptide (TPR) repeat protein